MLNSSLNNMEYLFASLTAKVEGLKKHGKKIIDMGIGDTTLPIGKTVIDAGVDAVIQMGRADSFRGYGSASGYDFLKDAIIDYYKGRTQLFHDEIFISDGAKSDCGGITDIFSGTVQIPNPIYPVYKNSNLIAGNNIVYMSGSKQNGFKPAPDYKVKAAATYICSPSNPTGVVYTRDELAEWVNYAKKVGGIIIFDSAYEAYITEDYPHSIFEISGADEVAIEINSFSKSAGFTGLRCGYTIIKNPTLKKMWANRQASKFNGVSYPVQRMAEAAYSKKGRAEWQESVNYYLDNARLLKTAIEQAGAYCAGGVNSPYVWFDCEQNSFDFFERLLDKGLVCTAGAGFGNAGQNFMRVTGFSSKENTALAAQILYDTLKMNA